LEYDLCEGANDEKPAKLTPAEQMREAGKGKIPQDWGEGEQAKREGDGWRWQDPNNSGNNVRIMKGNPNSPKPEQQVDYVKITSGGKVIDTNAKPITVAKPTDAPRAHIPLSNWLNWSSWNNW
jgi:hypothetical protein